MKERSSRVPSPPAARQRRHHDGAVAVLLCCTLSCTPLRELSSYSEESTRSAGGDAPAAGGTSSAPAAPERDRSDGFVALDASGPAAFAASDAGDAGESVDAGAPSAPLACGAPGEFAAADGRCYLLGTPAASWAVSSAACDAWGGVLARIDSPEEEALLVQNAAGDTWVGLNDLDVEGDMRWDGGGELGAYTRWAPQQPDDFAGSEDCVALLADGRGWNDRPCADLRAYFCER